MSKVFFSAVPLRAMGDKELSALDHLVLQCIAFHDRMSLVRRTGQGCWASGKKMALEVGCDRSTLSSVISRLAKRGYITREKHHFCKRTYVYRVVYEQGDSFSDEKTFADTPDAGGLSSESQTAAIVSRDLENISINQDDDDSNYIPLSGKPYSVKTGKTNSAETAQFLVFKPPIGEPEANNVAHMAMLERSLKRGYPIVDISGWRAWLFAVADKEADEAEVHQASRLLDDIGYFDDDD